MKRVNLLYSSYDFNNVEGIKYLDAHNDISEKAKELIKVYNEPSCEAKTIQRIQCNMSKKYERSIALIELNSL